MLIQIIFGVPLAMINWILFILLLAVIGVRIEFYIGLYGVATLIINLSFFIILAFLVQAWIGKLFGSPYLKYGSLSELIFYIATAFVLYSEVPRTLGSADPILRVSYLPYAIIGYALFLPFIIYGYIELYEKTEKPGFLVAAILYIFVPALSMALVGLSLISLAGEIASFDEKYLKKLREEIETIKVSIPSITNRQIAKRLGLPEYIIRLALRW